MESGGSFPYGDLPEDPDDLDDEDDAPRRGWLPPEDRLWRHPSEIARLGTPRALPPSVWAQAPQHRWRERPVLTAAAVGVAAMAAAAVAFTLTDSLWLRGPSGSIAATETSLVTDHGGRVAGGPASASGSSVPVHTGPDVVHVVTGMRSSLVGLEPVGGATPPRVTGVVLPGGDLVVTAASAVAGASRIDVLTSDGKRHHGRLMGADARSGVAVVKVDDTLTPAAFADENVQVGEQAVAACLCAAQRTWGASGPTVLRLAMGIGMVRQVGVTVTLEDGSELIDAIVAGTPLGQAPSSGVLLDGRGQVIGVLDGLQSAGDDPVGYFVPASLVMGVARQLASGQRMADGWLGVVGADEPGEGGVLLTGVLGESPAASAGLRAGDIVQTIDSHRVVSLADLKARLYLSSPGTTVQLGLARAGGRLTVTVTLGSVPGG